ncbi:MAG: radical SAM protein [Acidobacteria bacterium]|nr:radical SAM protein [Acidobacteriota bacterium]
MISRAQFDAIAAEGITRAWDGLGGSHTFVTYPPLDALRPLSPEPVLDSLAGIGTFSLYVHLPFCEMACPFCPYETNVVSDSDRSVDVYLRALAIEMKGVAQKLQKAKGQSLYVGGGTATFLTEAQLTTLFSRLKDHFDYLPDAVVCVETSPNALIENPSKTELLERLGVKRVSVGVQTLAETALRNEGRTHSPSKTLEMLRALIQGINVVNVDLMQDMPGQTDDDLENDFVQIAALGPAQITSYVERLRRSHGKYPDSYRSVVRRLWIRDRMRELGYQARPGGRFIRQGAVDDPFKSVRCGLDSHLAGLGTSAYGHVPGYFYRNATDTASYVNMVQAGLSPISLGVQLRKIDLAAATLASGIRWGVRLPQSNGDVEEYLCQAAQLLETLLKHGLVRFDSGSGEYRITDGLGWAYEEEICSLFVPQDFVDTIRARNLPWWFRGQSPKMSYT